jgi:hypothetical protein
LRGFCVVRQFFCFDACSLYESRKIIIGSTGII